MITILPTCTLDSISAWAAAACAVDADLYDADRLEFDALLRGNGLATVIVHVTDREHRWYQQEIGVVRALLSLPKGRVR